MKNDIISLDEVYENNELFCWTNCMGEVNMPGDPENRTIIHKVEELPPIAKTVYDQTEFGSGLGNYVVSFRGKIGFLINVLVDESWLQDVLKKNDVEEEADELLKHIPDVVERIADTLEEFFGVPETTYSVLLGENTDPDGHELMFFVEEPYVNTYKKLLYYLDSRIYKMLRRALQKIGNQDPSEE